MVFCRKLIICHKVVIVIRSWDMVVCEKVGQAGEVK